MTIRIGLPEVAAPRLHVGWNAARQSLTSHIRSVQMTAERLVQTPYAWGIRVVADFRQRFNLRNRKICKQHAMLKAFDDRYEQMVDVLCLAAQAGIATSRESRYCELQTWMCANYNYIRLYLHPYWADSQYGFRKDPFESLISGDRIDDVLTSCSSIEDMIMCRSALDGYRRALESAR